VHTGWARIDRCAAPLKGSASYSFSEASMLKTVVAVLGTDPVRSALFPVVNDDSTEKYMGFAVANPGGEAIDFDVEIIDEKGVLVDTLAPPEMNPLPAHGQIAKFVHELGANLETFKGSVILRAREGARFIAIGLVLHQGIYTATPIFEKDASQSSDSFRPDPP
jgi:hypothetical protein